MNTNTKEDKIKQRKRKERLIHSVVYRTARLVSPEKTEHTTDAGMAERGGRKPHPAT